MPVRPSAGPNHNGRYDDGHSRQFQSDSTNPRQVLAQVIAEFDGWAEIRPSHWAEAGALVKALRIRGLLVDHRKISTTPKEQP